MNTLNTLSSGTLVHLVFEQNGKRSWFNRTDRKYDQKTGVWSTVPLVGTEPRESVPMRLDWAIVAQKRWREELGFIFRITLEANQTSPFVDPDPNGAPTSRWQHVNYDVTCDVDGRPSESPDAPYAYKVLAVHSVRGKEFVLKFETPILQNQAQFATLDEGPEAPVWKAYERGYCKIEPPKVNPHLEARRREAARVAAQQVSRIPNLRPGDRR